MNKNSLSSSHENSLNQKNEKSIIFKYKTNKNSVKLIQK